MSCAPTIGTLARSGAQLASSLCCWQQSSTSTPPSPHPCSSKVNTNKAGWPQAFAKKLYTPAQPSVIQRCARVAVTLFLAPYRARYLPAHPPLKRGSPLNHHLRTLTRFALSVNPSVTHRQAASHGRVIEKSLKASCKTAKKACRGKKIR